LDARAIDLVEEVSERLSRSQLSQINAALGAHPSEGGDRLDGLRLKEAYALLREGKVEAAICLVNSLRISQRLENEVLRFFDEAGLSSGKVPILEQRLSAKLEEISRDSPSVAETISVVHQLLNSELHSRKSEATSQSLINLKAELLNETAAQLGKQTSHALIAQEARIQRLEEQAQRKEADYQETLSSLRTKVEALTEELVKAGQEVSQFQTAQNARIQGLKEQAQRKEADCQETLTSLRTKVEVLTEALVKVGQEISQVNEKLKEAEAAMEECLISLRAELRALHEQQAISGEEAKGVQSFIEQSQKAAVQEVLRSLRAEVVVLSQDLAQVTSQCRSAQSANEVTLRNIEGKSQKAEAATQRDLSSLKQKAEILAEEHLKVGEEVKQVKRAQDTLIQSLDEKLNTVQAATQLALNILSGDFGTLRNDLDQTRSQCKQVQETMLQRLEKQSQKTEANAVKLHRAVTSLQDPLYHPHEVTLPTFIYSYEANTDQLHRTSLVTGEHSSHQVPSYTFTIGCCWSEVPGESLLITGGGYPTVGEVVRIDTRREFAVAHCPPMLTPRYWHAAVYHTPHLYILGG
jgi:chromosome segregation ATPase